MYTAGSDRVRSFHFFACVFQIASGTRSTNLLVTTPLRYSISEVARGSVCPVLLSLADPLLLSDESQYRETDQPCGPCHSNRHAVQVAYF